MSNGDTPDLPPRDPAATAESADALPPDEAQATSAENPPAPAAYFGLSGHLFRFHPARRFGVIRPA